MTQPGTPTGSTTPPTTSPAPAETDHPISEPTAPLWFGDRSGQRYPGATAPTPPSWAGSGPAAPPTTPPSSQSSGARRVWPAVLTASLLSAALASGGTYATVRAADGNATSPSTASSAASPAGSSAGAQQIRQVNPNAPDWTATAATVTPSVVAISLQVQGGSAQGSGVVIDSSGHILTNNHVVDGAVEGTIEVTLADGRKYPATVAGTDPSTDLAVITVKNPPSDMKAIAMGDSDALKVGDPVMAVGNPLGLASTVTTGIVSALNRPVTTGDSQAQYGQQQTEPVYTNAIQTSAAINPGNSGGALVDADGKLIGINSSIASTGSNSGNIGIGFAIPVVEAQAIATQLIASGKAQHAYLGVTLRDGEATDGSATRAGAQVGEVSPNTPAQAAGLQAGDVVIAVDGTPVESRDSLIAKIRAEQVGSTVKLTVIRGGARQDVSVTLAVRPATAG
ncbi:MAG TPA: trypsin-like peptidase domain-containing protein [Tetrasphaera sp.]|uniref:S1C family serine protease n=1 Tax=Nostocoides sp. TaxID=1917966 RepID=UPI002BF8B1C1|nr:trypsin-like peptidase domain-containing protein [Tetrasphaera sp.]HNQ06110.1 trypsin-like peptidase domain-containing protein [Tetrasphaera sp.]